MGPPILLQWCCPRPCHTRSMICSFCVPQPHIPRVRQLISKILKHLVRWSRRAAGSAARVLRHAFDVFQAERPEARLRLVRQMLDNGQRAHERFGSRVVPASAWANLASRRRVDRVARRARVRGSDPICRSGIQAVGWLINVRLGWSGAGGRARRSGAGGQGRRAGAGGRTRAVGRGWSGAAS